MTDTTLEPDLLVERPAGELWHRAADVLDVSTPKREIELVVIPYNTPTIVKWDDRMVEETIDPGAFAGIERRANRIKVNREHMRLHTVGRAVAFYPSREEGLVANIRIAKTPLGDETLTLAEEGDLDASAGFLPMDGGMKWQNRSGYRITKAWLGHIAMTSDPAYPDARVLAVRSEQPPEPPPDQGDARPNLTAVTVEVQQARFAAINARWSA